jgi:hypothetical protein
VSLYPVIGCSTICCAMGLPMWRGPSGQNELKASAMIASLGTVSWFFQPSHWATSRAEIASIISGIETLCAISMCVPFAHSFRGAKVLNADTAKHKSHGGFKNPT